MDNSRQIKTILQPIQEVQSLQPREIFYTIGDRTPLHFASENGHPKVMTILIEAGANLNARNKSTNKHSPKEKKENILNTTFFLRFLSQLYMKLFFSSFSHILFSFYAFNVNICDIF